MKVTFWGVRGSIPTAGPETLRHGGNTACVEVRSDDGTLVVLDCGTGAFRLGQALAGAGGPVKGALLIGHTHWDHIQGVPFFAPLFAPQNEWDIYAPRGFSQSLRDTLAGQMQHTYFPITLDAMGATIRYHELVEGAFEIGGIRVRAQYLDHPAITLGYRLEADGAAVVYACDHESVARQAVPDAAALAGAEARHVAFLQGADLVIHDAQYTVDEYPAKTGWGHSTHDYAAAVCRAAGARRLMITHHDPMRSDDALDGLVADLCARLGGEGLEIAAAAEGATVTAAPRPRPAAPRETAAAAPAPSALAGDLVALAPLPEAMEAAIRAAAAALSMPVAAADRLAAGAEPSLLIAADAAGAEAARAAAGAAGPRAPALLALTRAGEADWAEAAGADDRLAWPFSEAYAAARIRAATLRTQCRWVRADLPEDEGRRLDQLHSLEILDSAPEERFDRIARMAAAALDAPIALVSLIDADRQWFKSCIGVDLTETPREMAFCAHTILEDQMLVVPDTLLDPRFADHPFVVDGPRVRFYAGCPLRPDGRHGVGTLCLIDMRPRDLTERQTALLIDFAKLAEEELARG